MHASLRRSLFAVLALAVMGLAAPASAGDAPPSVQDLQAAGAGTVFTDPVGGTQYQWAGCLRDSSGDVISLEEDGATVDEDRADLVEQCTSYEGLRLDLTARVADPTDPATDVNWQASVLGWFIDVDGDGASDFFAELSLDEDGNVRGRVLDLAASPAEEVCTADWGYADGQLSLSADAECLGTPENVAVSAGLIYDQRVEDPNGVAVFDAAPDEGNFDEEYAGGGLPLGVTRFAGQERIETAIDVSKRAFPNGADAVVLARADLFPDAIAGTPLAIQRNAPVLLTPTDQLSPLTRTEIRRLLGEGMGDVYLLGGEAAISSAVEQELAAIGYDVTRYGGSNRFETATEIATDGLGSPTEIFLADGGTFQDALIAGPAAAVEDAAILLTDGETIPPATQAYLDTVNPDVTAIGNAAAAAAPDADAIAGGDPIQTAVLVAERYFPDTRAVGVARADVFADALSGGALIGGALVGQGPAPLLYVESDDLPASVEQYLNDQDIVSVAIFGGVSAIGQAVEAEIAASID